MHEITLHDWFVEREAVRLENEMLERRIAELEAESVGLRDAFLA